MEEEFKIKRLRALAKKRENDKIEKKQAEKLKEKLVKAKDSEERNEILKQAAEEKELRNKRECTVCCEQISSPDEWMVL